VFRNCFFFKKKKQIRSGRKLLENLLGFQFLTQLLSELKNGFRHPTFQLVLYWKPTWSGQNQVGKGSEVGWAKNMMAKSGRCILWPKKKNNNNNK
jgi:hypothetical protein